VKDLKTRRSRSFGAARPLDDDRVARPDEILPRVKRICVFCGSNRGARPAYTDAARALGELFAREGITLVYGGGSVGLMGEIADATLAAGGDVIGVIPRPLWDREVGHRGLTDLRIVESMHERKTLMSELSDAFIAMPGGLGTFEEIFEIWTWAQLGMHRKPVGFLNVDDYYSPLVTFLDRAVAEGFMKPELRAAATFETDGEALLRRFASYTPPDVRKWIDDART
jgi:uncharacterized protein (TIGR00730 family)